jgi:hypothetical protein
MVWSTITSLDCSTYKGLRNVVVAHVKYNISHRNYPGGTEQKLYCVNLTKFYIKLNLVIIATCLRIKRL